MKISRLFIVILVSILLIASFACKKKHSESVHEVESEGEGEETGPRLTINDTYDSVRNGVRLTLAYNRTSSSFIGTVENVTGKTIKSVRVEVHLSNRTELGPTKPIDLASGNKENVKLSATGQSFVWWKAHAETGEGEHKGEHEHEQGEKHEHEHGEHEHEHGEEH